MDDNTRVSFGVGKSGY